MSKQPQQNYYAFLPAPVLNDNDLKPNEKILYAVITSLTHREGYCYASNAYLAERFDVTRQTVSNWISNLKEKGYLTVKINEGEGNRRHIYTAESYRGIKKNLNTYKGNPEEGIKKNLNRSIKDSNKESSKDKLYVAGEHWPPFNQLPQPNGIRQYPDNFEDIWDLYPRAKAKHNKGKGYKAVRARLNAGADWGDILESVKKYAKFIERGGEDWTWHLSTFFNKDNWVNFIDVELEKLLKGGGQNGEEFSGSNTGQTEADRKWQEEIAGKDFG